MSKLQSIEQALIEINETIFQELCDSYLVLRNENYSAFSRTGSQSGKQKTRKGTPDSFLLLPNGKYIFVEYSTNVSSGLKKLKEDIEKCLDEEKTGISKEDIEEIILCMNFNLKTHEVEELNVMLSNTKIELTLYTLDRLAIELHLNHRDLVHEYLGLPLDTGQIVSIDTFIEEYNRASHMIATPLDNVFMHREKEVEQLTDAIRNSDFTIVTGEAGVGKTKLVLETIKKYLIDNNDYNAYCVSYKSCSLLEDLSQYLDQYNNYILFVDDANRIDAFNQIIGFYRRSRKGNLKIVITVRDYALQDIEKLCYDYSPTRIDIDRLKDEQIIDIIKAYPFNILNSDYHTEIVSIADGNPRLAIMAALLAKAEQNLLALNDVSALFENYFSTFIRDEVDLTKNLNIQCLGLISFFYTVPYKEKELMEHMLHDFDITYSEFIDTIDVLEKWELVEIQFDYVKVPEQNLSTYFFYKAFVKEELLSFEILLNNYFDSYSDRFKECVVSANNNFGYKNVMNKLRPILTMYLTNLKDNEDSIFKFLSTFWFYLQNETLEYLYNRIYNLTLVEVKEYNTYYKQNEFTYNKNEIIEIIGEFFRLHTSIIKDALELVFEFVRRKPEHLPELIHKIRETLLFDRSDEYNGFYRQQVLFELMINGLDRKDELYSTSFYELAKTFLGFEFRHDKVQRDKVIFYNYLLPNNKYIKELREFIWSAILRNYSDYPKKSLELLMSYLENGHQFVIEIIELDARYILEMVDKYLKEDIFEHCLFVQKYIRWCKTNSYDEKVFPSLKERFTNLVYEMYVKLDWNRLRDKEEFEFEDYREYAKLKEEDIRISFILNTKEDVDEFFEIYNFLKDYLRNNWSYDKVLDIIIDENFHENFNIGLYFLEVIIKDNNNINYIPNLVFKHQLNDRNKIEQIKKLIQNKSYKNKIFWVLSFYESIDESLIDKTHPREIVKYLVETEESITISLTGFSKYLNVQPDLFKEILEQVIMKNSSGSVKIRIWDDVFNEYLDYIGDSKVIKQTYLQQYILDPHFDYRGEILIKILKTEPEFLYEFIEDIYSKKRKKLFNHDRSLGFIWEIDKIEDQLEVIFDTISKKETYFGISGHFCNIFFKGIKPEYHNKADNFLLNYVQKNFNNIKKMNMILNIVNHSRKSIFNNILKKYISLNQDPKSFAQIWWLPNSRSFSGDVILGDLEAADWKNILDTVNEMDIGIKLIPIKRFIGEKIDSCIKSGEWERKQKFLRKF